MPHDRISTGWLYTYSRAMEHASTFPWSLHDEGWQHDLAWAVPPGASGDLKRSLQVSLPGLERETLQATIGYTSKSHQHELIAHESVERPESRPVVINWSLGL